MVRRKTKTKIEREKEQEIAGLKEQLARALADYDNLRKRVENERDVLIKFSSEKILIKILPVLDMFESAQEHLKDSGLALALVELRKVLNEEGIEEIKPKVDDKFDTNVHEAVEVIDGDRKGCIAEVILPGWKFKDGKVIRYAKVKVYGEKLGKKGIR